MAASDGVPSRSWLTPVPSGTQPWRAPIAGTPGSLVTARGVPVIQSPALPGKDTLVAGCPWGTNAISCVSSLTGSYAGIPSPVVGSLRSVSYPIHVSMVVFYY